MRMLVTWGSQRGGTEGIARDVAEELQRRGLDVVAAPAAGAPLPAGIDGVIVGGALYANRWSGSARRFVCRNIGALRQTPTWFFSSGPLDKSADDSAIGPVREVGVLMERVGALGHMTFGGRLAADATGFPASAMAQKKSGDWRNFERIHAWADEIASALPTARPREASEPPGRSIGRLLTYGTGGWAICAALMGGLMATAPAGVGLAVHGVAAPIIFVFIARAYFGSRGAREPLTVAITFTTLVAILDAIVVAALVMHSFVMFTSIAGTWLPFALIFAATWATGAIMAMIPDGAPKLVKG